MREEGGSVSGDVGLNLDMQREKTSYHKVEREKRKKRKDSKIISMKVKIIFGRSTLN